MTQQKEYFNYSKTGELINIPSPTSSKDDFNFFKGKWKIKNRRLKTRLNNCTEWIEFDADQEMKIMLHGLGNIDHFYATFDDKPFEGMSLRFFDTQTKLWSIYWSDVTKTGVLEEPVLGSFYGDLGVFYTKHLFEGKEVLMKFEWDKSDPNNPIWRQGFSEDDGKTWEWNWYMYASRVID